VDKATDGNCLQFNTFILSLTYYFHRPISICDALSFIVLDAHAQPRSYSMIVVAAP
jgi:hypothetical protein